MEKHKIIIRVVSSVDTRTKKIILNEEYKMLHKKFNKEVLKMQNIVTEGISDEELEIFNKTLGKMKENVYNFLNKEEGNDN
jgi:DNA-binding MarR family transcriptional regulator